MAKCSFCGGKVPQTGKMFVKTDGKILFFDSSKCERSFKMKRDGVKTKWTLVHRKMKKK